MLRREYQVVKLGYDSLEEQVSLYKLVFEINKSQEDCASFWRRKHYDNPSNGSLIFGLFLDGLLVGMNAYLPATYELNGKQIKTLQSCESCVHPNYQGKGIWGAIVKHAVEYIFAESPYELILGFPNYKNSYPGFQKMGWVTLHNMSNYIMVNNPKAFAQSVVGDNKLLGIIAYPLKMQKLLIAIGKQFRKDLSVADCKELDLCWTSTKNTISLYPDTNWITWKFGYKDLMALSVIKNSEKIASCVYHISDYSGVKILILDNVTLIPEAQGITRSIIQKISSYLLGRYKEVAFIRTWIRDGDKLEVTFKSLGYLRSSHPNPFIVKLKNDDYAQKEWCLSFLDLD